MKSLKRFLGLTLMTVLAAVCLVAIGSATVSAATSNETVVFSFDSTAGWWGDVTPTLTTTGQKEGTGYFTTTTGKIMAGNLASTIDLSDAQALKLWVYISDASKLVQSGPQLYLDVTHKDNEPILSTFWTKSGLQTGWNELIFHMSESASTTETNLSAIKFIHIRIDTTAAVTFGLDSLRKLVPIQPTVTQLDTFETLTNHWGTGTLQLVSTGAPQGTSYVKVVTKDVNNAYVIAGSWTAVDLRKYAADGVVRLKVYVDNAANLVTGTNQGAVELNDNASGIIAWNNISTQLVTGWNQLTLKLSQATTNTANLANITSFRFFQHTNATGTFFGLDDLNIMNADATNQEVNIFSFDNTSGWWGDVTAPSLATAGQKEGTGFFNKVTTTTQTDTVIAGNLANTVDVTDAYALKMWVYVSDASKLVLTGPQFYLDITHVTGAPTNTTSWTANGLKSGWNELTFNMSDAVISGTTLSAIKFIQARIVPASGRQVTFGLDSLRKIVTIPPTTYYQPKYASALRQIDATNTIGTPNNYSSSIYGNEKWKITGIAVEQSGIHFVDTGILEVTSIDNKIALSKKFSNINLSEYAASGSLYMLNFQAAVLLTAGKFAGVHSVRTSRLLMDGIT